MSRHIRDIRDLPISQLTDEEICKAARHRLGADCCVITIFYHKENHATSFVNWKNKEGKSYFRKLEQAWGNVWGKMKRLPRD